MAKFSKWVENTVGKGEISRYEQFLLFPHCFQKACFPGASKGVMVWEWVKVVLHRIQNIVEKGENAIFLLFPLCFQKAFPRGCQKPSLYGKGLILFQTTSFGLSSN